MSEERDIVERALLDDLERQNPDMRQDPERETVWLSGGATPQTCGTFINVHDLAEAVEAALAREAASELQRLRGEVERLREGLMPYLEKVANLANAMIASGDYVASGSLLKLTTAEAAALLSSAPKPEEG